MAAPLIVHTEADRRADAQEMIVLLHDFTFRDPAQVLAELTGRRRSTHGGMSMPASRAGMMSERAITMHGADTSGHMMPMPAGGAIDLNDVDYDAYLANDRTLNDPLVLRTRRSGRVRLRLINGATATAFWIDLGALQGTVVAVDGDPVQPHSGPALPDRPGPASGYLDPIAKRRRRLSGAGPARRRSSAHWFHPCEPRSKDHQSRQCRRRGDASHRSLAGTASHQPCAAGGAPARRDPSHRPYRHDAALCMVDRRPSLANHQPLRVSKGQRVVLEMVNQSMMAHPMHLHGHHFQVIAINDQALSGAMRDTVLVPVHDSVTVAFDADDPAGCCTVTISSTWRPA